MRYEYHFKAFLELQRNMQRNNSRYAEITRDSLYGHT